MWSDCILTFNKSYVFVSRGYSFEFSHGKAVEKNGMHDFLLASFHQGGCDYETINTERSPIIWKLWQIKTTCDIYTDRVVISRCLVD